MSETFREVASPDGTTIAYDRLGDGPPVIVVCGAMCDRALMRPTAEELAKHFTVFNYDRRGRGDSSDTTPYAVEREIEDIGALIAEAGGTTSVYGHSSGAGLVLHAAAAGLPIAKIALHDPPYAPDGDEEARRTSREYGENLKVMLSEGRRRAGRRRWWCRPSKLPCPWALFPPSSAGSRSSGLSVRKQPQNTTGWFVNTIDDPPLG